MPWEQEHNRNSLSPHGLKKAQGHAPRTVHDANHVAGFDMPPPLRGDAPMSMTPHDAGFRQPVKIAPSSARPVNDMGPGLLPTRGCLDADPHPYTPAAQKQAPNTYRKLRR
jgi:hypothetical protein